VLNASIAVTGLSEIGQQLEIVPPVAAGNRGATTHESAVSCGCAAVPSACA
jgi:hypothetical protein